MANKLSEIGTCGAAPSTLHGVFNILLCWVFLLSVSLARADVLDTQLFDDATEDLSLLGHWYNEMGGARVGLILKSAGECELYISRFPNPESRSRCKFEKFADRFSLFIYKENGECGEDASFKFWYKPELGQVGLLSGASEILMSKK